MITRTKLRQIETEIADARSASLDLDTRIGIDVSFDNLTDVPGSLNQVFFQATAPSSAVVNCSSYSVNDGDIWIDSDTYVINHYDGTDWSEIQANLDNVPDGATYGKILSSALSEGAALLSAAVGSLDDVSNGSSYGRVLLTDISAGHILLSSVDGDLDDISDGANYGRVAATDISAGHILLAETTGDLDDISDGANYAKIALTSISAGKIIVAGLDSGVTNRMFDDSAKKTNIEGWIHASDATMIDGGDIYTNTITATQIAANTITATQINGAGLGTLTITSGKIAINTTDALEIQASGNVKVLQGADIIFMGGSSGNPSILSMRDGSGVSSEVRFEQQGTPANYLAILKKAYSSGIHYLEIGAPSLGSFTSGLYLGRSTKYSVNTDYMSSFTDTNWDVFVANNSTAKITIDSTRINFGVALEFDNVPVLDFATPHTYLKAASGGAFVLQAPSGTNQYVFNSTLVSIAGHKTKDLAESGAAFDDIYADDFQNVADFFFLDDRDDIQVLADITGSGNIDPRTGLEMIDDNTLAPWMLSKDKSGDKIIVDPDGKPYVTIKMWVSLLRGAICQLNRKTEKYHDQIVALNDRVVGLNQKVGSYHQ